MTDEEIRGLLRDLRDESIPADSLARFRSGLERKLERGRSFWRMPAWALAIVALALAVTSFEWWPMLHRPEPARIANRVALPPPIDLPVESPRPEMTDAIIRVPRHTHQQPAPAVSIRIETPDPNVVILLVGD